MKYLKRNALRTRRLVVAGMVLMTVAVLGAQWLTVQAQTPINIQGVWRITEVTFTGPNARTDTNPQPGLHLYRRRHFSLTAVTGARAGTYEIKGNELITRPVTSPNPNVMGNVFTTTIRLEGDALWITQKQSGPDGPAVNPVTAKLTRVKD
jgi:hypothetical protein